MPQETDKTGDAENAPREGDIPDLVEELRIMSGNDDVGQ